MSEIPDTTPRDEEAPIVDESLIRPTASRRIWVMLSVFYAIKSITNISAQDFTVSAELGWLGALLVSLAATWWIFKHPDRLRAVWRGGKVGEVRVTRTWYLLFKQSLCRVEHGNDRAFVLITGEPARGTTLRALAADGWLGVIDDSGRLRLARLRAGHQR